jgi:hypothetical protein
MTAALLERPLQSTIFGQRAESVGTRLTLDDVLVGAWEGLSACHTVACPACGGAMAPRRTNGGPGGLLVRGGACGSCHTTLG